MKPRVISALLLSVAFIGSALFIRLSRKTHPPVLVSVVDNFPDDPDLVMKQITGAASVTPLAAPSPTDNLSQKLVSDYMTLKSSNQADEENIQKLADVYSARIAATQVPPSTQVNPSDLRTIPDSSENLITYNQKILSIRSKYENQSSTLGAGGGLSDMSDPRFKRAMETLSNLYAQAAKDLEVVSVPVSLASNHAALITNYLSNSVATRSLANIEQDPLGAFSAMNIAVKNVGEEERLISNIRLALNQKGILTN